MHFYIDYDMQISTGTSYERDFTNSLSIYWEELQNLYVYIVEFM